MDTSDMPTAEELRLIARAAFEKLRGPATNWDVFGDLRFAKTELTILGDTEIYDQEFRRHELLKRGFTPPE